MAVAERPVETVSRVEAARLWGEAARWWRAGLSAILTPFAQPLTAGLIALVAYFFRASLNENGFKQSAFASFNYLADAFLHGQLYLRQIPSNAKDLVYHNDRLFLYWPPFPAVVVTPLVRIFGIGLTDITYTAIFGAISVGLIAKLLAVLSEGGVAPLSVERRALLVITVAFGSVVLILSPFGEVWFTAQLIGFGCVLLATIAALAVPGRRGYFLTGLALGCALATRNDLVFNGIWLAYFLLRRDWGRPARERAARVAWGLAPVVAAALLLAWYNWARFGSPIETGVRWHLPDPFFQADFERYGVFNLHYLPTNLKHQFWTYPVFTPLEKQTWLGGGLFWMSPTLLAAPWAIVRQPRNWLVWALVLSAVIVYIPIGLLMGTGWVTYGPRYLLDLMVPILVLAAMGLRRWPLWLVFGLTALSCASYIVGSRLWMLAF